MIYRIQRSWRQFCDVTVTGSFQTDLEIIICRWLQSPSQLTTPLYSQLILRIYAAMNRLGGGAKMSLPPGAANPWYATADWKPFCGAPFSGVCRNFWGGSSSHKGRNHEWCERARPEKECQSKGVWRHAAQFHLSCRLSMSVLWTSP